MAVTKESSALIISKGIGNFIIPYFECDSEIDDCSADMYQYCQEYGMEKDYQSFELLSFNGGARAEGDSWSIDLGHYKTNSVEGFLSFKLIIDYSIDTFPPPYYPGGIMSYYSFLDGELRHWYWAYRGSGQLYHYEILLHSTVDGKYCFIIGTTYSENITKGELFKFYSLSAKRYFESESDLADTIIPDSTGESKTVLVPVQWKSKYRTDPYQTQFSIEVFR